ncbi:SDR family NAD(P)-dependent oxidoreductase [Teredinibacter franksiae]|uniref:SDR family NAD(P)-dependent oxidoreductase n=1 Tax=Teredinibacter franksiae TaxID=2761453 RepID=UPI00162A9272|nr:SDR family NAD(P)-dependent oxidoreductase [Teredinibacter franksiae]
MTGKFVVVTGCSTGIGLCAATMLTERGYRVIATVRDSHSSAALKAAGIHTVLPLELADSASVSECVQKILEITNEQVFAVFNNAAYGQPGAVEDLSRETLRKQFETNLFGTHQFTMGLLPSMLKMDDARIIQNSSVLGFVAMPMRGAYNASKFALEGLSDTLRLELKDSAVKVVLIEPGPITSAFRKNALVALEREINFNSSRHRSRYETAIARLQKAGPTVPFTLPPQAVVKSLLHALESTRPKYRYRVTFPTHLMAVLKVLLPNWLMDKVLGRF